jgi:hypothetical protein
MTREEKQQDEVMCQINFVVCHYLIFTHRFCNLRLSFIENFLCTIITIQQVMGLRK